MSHVIRISSVHSFDSRTVDLRCQFTFFSGQTRALTTTRQDSEQQSNPLEVLVVYRLLRNSGKRTEARQIHLESCNVCNTRENDVSQILVIPEEGQALTVRRYRLGQFLSACKRAMGQSPKTEHGKNGSAENFLDRGLFTVALTQSHNERGLDIVKFSAQMIKVDGSRIVRGARARRRCGMAWQDHSELFVVDTDNTPCAHALFVCAAESRPPRPWQALLLASESCLACHSPLLRNHPAFWPIVLRVQDEEHGRWFLVAGLPG
ncbi:hypothetical protein KCV03_g152, partial [Aureobasidium melanogenum]